MSPREPRIKTRKCSVCGLLFEWASGPKNQCSFGCQREEIKNKIREKNNNTEDATCAGCATVFARPRSQSNRRYCTAVCRGNSIKIAATRPRFFLFKRDEFRCIYCGLSSIENSAELSIDHIVPRCGGGSDTAKNLVTCCCACNSAKGPNGLSADIASRMAALVAERNRTCGIPDDQKIDF
jgi:hypothetical protein